MVKLIWKLGKSRLGFLAIGAGIMYLFDPEKGQTRRSSLQSQAQGFRGGSSSSGGSGDSWGSPAT